MLQDTRTHLDNRAEEYRHERIDPEIARSKPLATWKLRALIVFGAALLGIGILHPIVTQVLK